MSCASSSPRTSRRRRGGRCWWSSASGGRRTLTLTPTLTPTLTLALTLALALALALTLIRWAEEAVEVEKRLFQDALLRVQGAHMVRQREVLQDMVGSRTRSVLVLERNMARGVVRVRSS